jgi:hypothetical protein
MSDAAESYACMVCLEPARDADETEWRYDNADGSPIPMNSIGSAMKEGRAFVVFWVYCRACDCWTEHPIGLDIGDEARAALDNGVSRT